MYTQTKAERKLRETHTSQSGQTRPLSSLTFQLRPALVVLYTAPVDVVISAEPGPVANTVEGSPGSLGDKGIRSQLFPLSCNMI